MVDYFVYYATSNIVGFIIFFIMLAHDYLGIDRQEKQLKYDHALMAFMLYFVSDAIWAGVDSGVFPANMFTVLGTDLSNYVIMTAITYTWLRYVMAVEQVPNRNTLRTRLVISLPFGLSIVALIITYLVAPSLLINEQLKTTAIFDVFLVTVPYIYILAEIIYSMKMAIHEENPVERRKQLYIGLFPIMVIAGGLIQMVFMPRTPFFCFSSTVLMIMFYIQSMDAQISTDPLTRLNNRGQLARYVSQGGNLRMEGRSTYVVMIDVNDFKMVNDSFGHAEGDEALVIVAQSLVGAVRNVNMPMFLGRYGGDEFVMIAHPIKEKELQDLIESIRENVRLKCYKENKPYVLSVGIGYDLLLGEQDTFQKCMQRADSKLYLDKEYCKINGKSTTRR